MEPKLIEFESAEQPKINVKISFTPVPFGKSETRETYNYSKPEEVNRASYSLPTQTSVTQVVATSPPLVVITY